MSFSRVPKKTIFNEGAISIEYLQREIQRLETLAQKPNASHKVGRRLKTLKRLLASKQQQQPTPVPTVNGGGA